ncbi:MAG: hypothetical protein KGJ43_05075, partial [Acidobacteriota bacterium]|nr:hypothetical protein [Acidobacteriota bacterium]
MIASFNQIEPQRAIVFGPGAIERAAGLLGEGYTLLSTERALAGAPSVAERAGSVVEVPAGYVEVVAARLRPGVAGERLVALGGGRVIDVAKALAAAEPPRTVAAIPTTLSGAERPGVHRHAEGVPWEAARARPTL